MAAETQVFGDPGQDKVVALLLANNTARHVGWGSGTTAAAVTQTALVAANPESRTAGVISNPATNTHKVVATIEATAPRTAEEVGMFDASSAGNMIVRGTHATKSLVAADRIRYSISVVFKDSSEA